MGVTDVVSVLGALLSIIRALNFCGVTVQAGATHWHGACDRGLSITLTYRMFTMKLKQTLLAAAISGLIASATFAQTAPPAGSEIKAADAKPAEPEAQPLLSIWGFDLTGHVDVGYSRLTGSGDRKSTRLNSSHPRLSRMPSSA